MNKVLSAYQNLLLEPGADLNTIEKHYKFMTRGLHPDQHSSPEHKARAEATMKMLNAAIETLRKHFKTDHKDNGPCDCRPSGDPNASEQNDSDKARQEEEFAARRNEERQSAQQNSPQQPSEEEIRTAFTETANDYAHKFADKESRIKASIAAIIALVVLYAGAYWKANLKNAPSPSTSSSREPKGQRPFSPPPASSSKERVNLIQQAFREQEANEQKELERSMIALARYSHTEKYSDQALLNEGMNQALLDRLETRLGYRNKSQPWLAEPPSDKGIAKPTLDSKELQLCTDLLKNKNYFALRRQLQIQSTSPLLPPSIGETPKEKTLTANVESVFTRAQRDAKKDLLERISKGPFTTTLEPSSNPVFSQNIKNLQSLQSKAKELEFQSKINNQQSFANSGEYSYSSGSPYGQPVTIPGVAPASQQFSNDKFQKDSLPSTDPVRSSSANPNAGSEVRQYSNQDQQHPHNSTALSDYSYSPGSPFRQPVVIPGTAPTVPQTSGQRTQKWFIKYDFWLKELNERFAEIDKFDYLADKATDDQLVTHIKSLSLLNAKFLSDELQKLQDIPTSRISDDTIRLRFIYTDLSMALALKEPDEQQQFTYFSQASKCMQHLFKKTNSPLLSLAYARNRIVGILRYKQ